MIFKVIIIFSSDKNCLLLGLLLFLLNKLQEYSVWFLWPYNFLKSYYIIINTSQVLLIIILNPSMSSIFCSLTFLSWCFCNLVLLFFQNVPSSALLRSPYFWWLTSPFSKKLIINPFIFSKFILNSILMEIWMNACNFILFSQNYSWKL